MSDLINDNSNKKSRLGRGLGSLLGGANDQLDQNETSNKTQILNSQIIQKTNTQIPDEARIWNLSIDKLVSGEFQPRTDFDKKKIDELAESIKNHGILQPIIARKLQNNRFEIIAGERRWRAAQVAGLHEVPVIIKELANQKTLELALIENIQREDLSPLEEAEAYQRLAEEFNLTQQQVAERVGKERATVANSLRLLLLSPVLKDMLKKNLISVGHSKVLLSLLDQSKQVEFAKKVESENLSVRQLEKLVSAANKHKNDLPTKTNSDLATKLVSTLAEDLQKTLGTKVSIDYNNSKGKIQIHFYSDEELNQLITNLKEGHGKH